MTSISLIRYELQKYFTKFHVCLLAFLLLLNVGLTVFQSRHLFTSENQEIMAKKHELIELYNDSPEVYQKIYSEHQSRVAEYDSMYYEEMFSGSTKSMPIFENHHVNFDNYGDVKLFSEIEKIIQYPNEYRQNISSLLRDAILRLEESNENEYIDQYYIELCSRYGKFLNIKLDVVEVHGWNEYFSLQIPSLLLAVALISTMCSMFLNDHHVGMDVILRISKYGNKSLIVSKLISILIVTTALTLLFTLSPIIIFLMSSGLSSVNSPIQIIQTFQYCQYDISIGQYLLFYLILRIVFFSTFSLLVAVVSQVFKSDKLSFVTTTVLVISGLFLAEIPPSSPYYFIQKFSITELAQVNILFTRYRGLNFFGFCIDYTIVVIIFIPLIALLLIVLSLLTKYDGIAEYSNNISINISSSRNMSLFSTEMFKQIICTKYIFLVIFALILKCAISAFYYYPTSNYTELQYMDYIAQVSGKLTEEKILIIEEEANFIETALANYESASIKYRSGNLSYDEYQKYINQYNYAEYCKTACERLCDRRDYLVKISTNYPDVEFIYDEGLDRYYSSMVDIVAIITMLFIGSNVFSVEYELGFAKILRTTPRGRKNIFVTKLCYSILLSVALYLMFLLFELLWLKYYYNVDYWSIPVQSMPRFENILHNISIGEYMIIYQIVRFIGYICCLLLVTAFSALFESQLKAIIMSGLIIFIPYFLNHMNLWGISLLNYAEMISPQNIEKNIISYLICIATVIIFLIVSFKKWCGMEAKK